MADRLELEARFNDHASKGVKALGKTLESVRPSNGMRAAQKWMGEFRGAAEKAHVAVRPLATGLSAVGIGGLAASLSMSELVKQFKDLADSTLTMRELGRQSRMSATEIARLQYAAGKLHVDPAAVGGAISGWSSKMVEFRRHTGRFYTELLRQNSDVARKIAADNPVDGLKDTLDFLSRIKDPQIQKRWAEEAGVGDLVPMLGKGPQGLAEAFADAAREVKPISAEMQAAADRFNGATNRFNQSWSNLKNDIGPAVVDPLTRVIDKLDDGLKFAAQYPGDAAAAAATIAGTLAAFWARARIMRGSALVGGGGAMSRAAGAMAGAATQQKVATTTFAEAVAEFRLGVREMAGKGGALGGGGAGGAPGEGAKPNGASPGYGSLLTSAALAALNVFDLARNAPEQLEKAKTDNAPMDAQVGREADWGDRLRKFFRGSPSDMHPDDDRLSRARPDDLKREVQEGSKAGIIAGLRETAQQNELEGGAAGNSFGVKSSSGGLGGSGRHLDGSGHSGGAAIPGASLGDHARGGIGKGAAALAPRAREAFEFWKSKGLTPEQSAGLVGMEQGESMSDPNNKTGDGGQAHGAFQWHADRRRKIMAGAGIDIDQATHRQQLEAAYWEFQHTEQAAWAQVKRAQTATDSARAGTTFFERPGDKRGQSIVRGGMAEGWLKRFNDEDAKAKVPAGAGTPTPAAAAVTDAEVFAARQRLIAGGHDPKDVALRDRYLKEQNTPKGHAAGGAIRGAGSSRSDSIPAWLSNGEFVVNARASGQWLPFLHAINSGRTYADGGEVAAGAGRRRSWLDFFQRSRGAGGMGAARHVALGATAMMMGESGRNMNPSLYGWDVNGPSGGTAQWHDVTTGKYAGKLHRLSDLMRMAMLQHEDWHSVPLQQANWKREATGSLAGAWAAMRRAGSASEALRQGINKFENPADHLGELRRRLPNIVRLAREGAGGGGETRVAHEIDPIQVDIRHHPHTGQPIVSARAGKGTKLGIRSGPTMQPT